MSETYSCKEWFKPRTLMAFMLYGTFCYLSIIGKITEQAVIGIVSVMMGHYFGSIARKPDKPQGG